jgi:hypothetical protein
MRLFTSALCTAVAVGLLAGCSGSNLGSSLPTGSQTVAPAAHSGMLLVSGVQRPQSCPGSYITCVTISKSTPAKTEICISTTGSCTSGSFPPFTWTQKIVTLKGKKFTSIVGSIKPKVGNPIEDSIKEKKKVKSSKGKVEYVQDIKACPASGSCQTGAVGIVTS